MKILYTITKSEIGGAQVHVAQLARYMKDVGNAVAIMSAPGGWLENEATKMGVRFYPNSYFANSFNPINFLKAKAEIRKAIKEWQPELVHTHSSFAGVLTRLVVRGKIPTIFTAHSWAFTDGATILRKIVAPIAERIVARYTKKIICVSKYDKNLALRYKIAPENKLTVIYNGVESIQGSNPRKENIFIAVGRLAYPKEYTLLLEAFASTQTEARLQIIGFGPDEKKIREKIRELSLESKVEMLTTLSPIEVGEKLLKAKAFILISRHEGFPMTILEAMSAGLPIIASRVGGIPEEIDSTCGILVSNDKKEIAEAIKILSNENKCEEMGRVAKVRFEENFTLEKFLEKTQKIYNEVLVNVK